MKEKENLISRIRASFINGEAVPLIGNGINYKETGDDMECMQMPEWGELIVKMSKGELPFVDDWNDDVSYPEWFTYIIAHSKSNTTHQEVKNEINKCTLRTQKVKMVSSFCENYKVPILTTNYDTNLDFSNSKATIFSLGKNETICSKRKYIEQCYSSGKDGKDPFSSNSVWHINGSVHYPLSMRLSYSDYCNQMIHLNHYIPLKEEIREGKIVVETKREYFENSWLRLFFRKRICVIGLRLSMCEVVLRWLLLRRRVLWNSLTNEECASSGWYCFANENRQDCTAGKRKYLESLGLTVVEFEKYSEMYQQLFEIKDSAD